jgi:2-haloacid dehalogenase
MIAAVVFDAYGTLFDVNGAARAAAAEPGGATLARVWEPLSRDWRQKQLEYTWLRSLMGVHADFEAVTADALDWTLEARGLAGDPALRDRLMALYRVLPAYPEAAAVLDRLGAAGRRRAILSNGSPAMLEAAVGAAGLAPRLDAVLSVEAVGVYKPARAVYDLVGRAFDTAAADVLFVSANGWDAAGAAACGFRTAWVNRAGAPVERLPARPDHVVPDLTPIPELAQ